MHRILIGQSRSPNQEINQSSKVDYIPSQQDNFTKRNTFKSNTKSTLDHINILGIELYFDDILLILLIYFLYTEGVTDIYLFLTLILLLLS